jgi:hypothetical protein
MKACGIADGADLPRRCTADLSCAEVVRLVGALHANPPASSQIAVLPSLAERVEERFATTAAEAATRSQADFAALAPKIQSARVAAAGRLRRAERAGARRPRTTQHRAVPASRTGIDPMPCIGDPAYDAAYWAADGHQGAACEHRCDAVAAHASLDVSRVLRWAPIIALA